MDTVDLNMILERIDILTDAVDRLARLFAVNAIIDDMNPETDLEDYEAACEEFQKLSREVGVKCIHEVKEV